MYRPSYFILWRTECKGFFSPSPLIPLLLFLIPVGSPTRDLRLLYSRVYHFNFCHDCCPHTFRLGTGRTDRSRNLQLNIYATIVCSKNYIYYRPKSNQKRALSLCIMSDHITFVVTNRSRFYYIQITYNFHTWMILLYHT